ncbi:thiamine diphosphokinase [Candidatus Liberibacter brunswickensis]|uniref:thiamine diphosphokinase n=1 Tax=Candidatus Liberibacter brunswickensis TaxID=1968796 RepID=UPI002FDFA4B8
MIEYQELNVELQPTNNNILDFAILLNGNVKVTERLLYSIKYCRIIAADGGIHHAKKLGVIPELWIGDFDSIDSTLLKQWSSIKRIFYSPNKDMSDGEITVHKALQLGAKNITLVGAISGERFDYSLQHLQLAISLKKNKFNVILTSGIEEAFILMPGKHYFDLPERSFFSIVAFKNIENITITGAKYTLSKSSLSIGDSHAISNVVKKNLTIIFDKGLAVLISRPYDIQRI